MPNQLNKNKNKLKEKDEIRTAQGNLILAQEAEHRRRFQKIATDGHRSAEALLETRQRVELVEEAREEFLNLCSPREENPDGRELTRTAQSAEGAKAWSELFVRDPLPEGTDLLNGDPSSPNSTATRIPSVSVEIPSVSVEIPSMSIGIPSVSVEIPSVSVGIPSVSIGIPSVNVGIPSVGVGMAGPKEKLPKFHGDEAADPIRHCKTCETIWRAKGATDTNEWVRQFLATLRGVAIDWFTGIDPQKLNSWDNIKKDFFAEFQLLRNDNEIVVEIFNTKQGKNETVRVFARKLKNLINKMENKPADGLQKRWFIEGLHPKLRKK